MGASATDELPLADRTHASGVTWRSLLVGSISVALVCLLTPYNDFVLSDTSLASGFLPLIGVVIQFLLIVLINAPLHIVAPSWALRPRELAVVVMMTLIACSLPNWGLMRFFIPTPVWPFLHGVEVSGFWDSFKAMNLPDWLFPVQNVGDPRDDPIAKYFYRRLPDGEPIPWGAWIKPLAMWGIYVVAMIATLVALGRMILDQWLVNERLPFPLVQVQAALVEAPRPGKALNDLLRSPGLWVGLGIVFAIHSLSSINAFWPGAVPTIPLSYDFNSIFADPPFSYIRTDVKAARLSFMVIGAIYFVRSRAALSLWAIYLIVSAIDVGKQTVGYEASSAAAGDQHLGACVAFILGMAYIGRHHWMTIIRNAFGLGKDTRYLLTFWIAVVGTLTMFGWLWFIGVQAWMAIVIVGLTLMAHVIVSRVAAETGLPLYRSSVNAAQIYTNLPHEWVGPKDVYFAGVFNLIGPLNSRDSMMAMSQHGVGVTRVVGEDARSDRRIGGVIVWTLVLGCILAGAATLYCQYTYPTPMTREIVPQGNNFGAVYVPKRDVVDPFVNYSTTTKFIDKGNWPWINMGIGFVVTCILEVLALRYAGWPFMPIGFVASFGAFIGNTWFSIFVGWLAKVLIVRFGGAKLLQQLRPLFVGIIFGEALAAAVFLVINAIMVFNGYESQSVKFLL